MLNKLTQTALVLVLGVVIVWGTYLLFQQWHDTVAPTAAEITALTHRATSDINFEQELTAWTNDIQTAQNIEIAGWIVMGVEALLAIGLLLLVITRPVPAAAVEPEVDDVAEMRRAYQR